MQVYLHCPTKDYQDLQNYGSDITNILGDGQFETMGTSEIMQGVTLKIVTSK